MILWEDYVKWFSDHYDVLKDDLLEGGSIECSGGPILAPKSREFPRSAPWTADWAVIFADGNYFRVKECFNRKGHPNAGYGVREHFSFHYGRAHSRLDSSGFPVTRGLDVPPPVLRIDVDYRLDPHIHLNSSEHIEQDRVNGYSIKDADMIEFLKAVIKHRATRQPIQEILGITVS